MSAVIRAPVEIALTRARGKILRCWLDKRLDSWLRLRRGQRAEPGAG
jgi:hypothetical protein